MYGGAHLFKSDLCGRLGAVARRSLADYAPDAAALARALDLPDGLADTVYTHVQEKLAREPAQARIARPPC